MIETIKLKHILIYIAFILIQLLVFSPKMVVGVNAPILFTYLFDLLNHRYVVNIRSKFKSDTTFIAILLSFGSLILIFSDVVLLGTTIMILTIAILWKK